HQYVIAWFGDCIHTANTRYQSSGRLPDPLVKFPTPFAPGDVDEQAIAHQTRLFVFVKAQVEELAQEPPTLRRPEGIGIVERAGARIALLRCTIAQKRDEIPRRQ